MAGLVQDAGIGDRVQAVGSDDDPRKLDQVVVLIRVPGLLRSGKKRTEQQGKEKQKAFSHSW